MNKSRINQEILYAGLDFRCLLFPAFAELGFGYAANFQFCIALNFMIPVCGCCPTLLYFGESRPHFVGGTCFLLPNKWRMDMMQNRALFIY